jgi:hypothetical protein
MLAVKQVVLPVQPDRHSDVEEPIGYEFSKYAHWGMSVSRDTGLHSP